MISELVFDITVMQNSCAALEKIYLYNNLGAIRVDLNEIAVLYSYILRHL